MRFQLPQFIETEIKIIGPFTLKQFLWVATGAVFLFLDFSVFTGVIAIAIAIPIVAISSAFAFLRIDDMPLINYVANMLSFSFGSKKYLYQDETNQNDILKSK
ncbi:MAG: PrgI family protein [Candidatus Pacebacteria bacterium]|nr:PrgI family protein [Candidatus Paceibacterota bacterium]